jgi:osmotically-inducible protein OsmY
MTSSRIPEERVEEVRVRLGGRVRNLRVLLREGQVVLLGNASSYHAKQLAQHFVQKSLGTTALVNEIEVQPVPPASDAENAAPD